jgi:hypothetical protein
MKSKPARQKCAGKVRSPHGIGMVNPCPRYAVEGSHFCATHGGNKGKEPTIIRYELSSYSDRITRRAFVSETEKQFVCANGRRESKDNDIFEALENAIAVLRIRLTKKITKLQDELHKAELELLSVDDGKVKIYEEEVYQPLPASGELQL